MFVIFNAPFLNLSTRESKKIGSHPFLYKHVFGKFLEGVSGLHCSYSLERGIYVIGLKKLNLFGRAYISDCEYERKAFKS